MVILGILLWLLHWQAARPHEWNASNNSGGSSSLTLTELIAKSDLFDVENSDCNRAKRKCNDDTDCFHRLLYVHTTCVTSTCKIQCKTAVLRLFQTQHGKDLLESDMECIHAVKGEIEQCRLDPKSENLHCTLAQTQCEQDQGCQQLLDTYDGQCESRLQNGSCPTDCANMLQRLFETKEGVRLRDCVCWRQDPLCQHTKTVLIDPCKREIDKQSKALLNTVQEATKERNRTPKTKSSSSAPAASLLLTTGFSFLCSLLLL